MKIKTRLTLAFVACGLVPLVVSSLLSMRTGQAGMEAVASGGQEALTASVQNQLDSICEIKASQLEAVAQRWDHDLTMLVESVRIQFDLGSAHLLAVADYKKKALESLFGQFLADLAAQQDRSICTKAMAQYEQFLQTGETSDELERYRSIVDGFVKNTHYLDFYIFNLEGVCVHSASQGPEFGRSIIAGDLADTNLARGVQAALAGESVLVDFEPYAPKDNALAAWAVAPINYSGKRTGAVALQLPVEPIDAIVLDRSGLGDSQESFVVGRSSDGRIALRSTRTLHGGAEFGAAIDGAAIQRALAGESGSLVAEDAGGEPFIDAYTPLNVAGFEWCMITTSALREVVAQGSGGDGSNDLLAEFARRNGYPNLYLVMPSGFAFYAAKPGADVGVNLLKGGFADSNLSRLIREVASQRQVGIADFRPYAPDGGREAAFIARPVLQGAETRFVVALRINPDAIDAVTDLRAGMGETGFSYVIGRDAQGRTAFRSDLSDMDRKYVLGSAVTTAYIEEGMQPGARAGGGIYTDSHGNQVIVAYAPIDIHGLRWGLFNKINAAEALASVQQMDATRASAVSALIRWSIGTALAAAALIAVFGVAFGSTLARPILLMSDRLRAIATGDGDLTQRVRLERQDEIGDLGRWFDQFVDSIHGIVEKVRGNTERVAAAATEVAASAEEMSASVDQQSERIDDVATAVDQLNNSVAQVAHKCGDAASESRQAGEHANAGGEIMSRTVSEMRNIAVQVNATANAVGNLGRKSEEIGQIIQVINDIADQTNLLALNAAIEAARAGEHGRGFAVVADEVRKLAERTQEATQQVSATIREIQAETKTAVDQMAQSRGKVDAGVELAAEAGTALEQIVASAAAVATEIGEIAGAADEQSGTAGAVGRSIAEIRAVTEQASRGAHQAAAAATDLSASAEDLRALVQRFKL